MCVYVQEAPRTQAAAAVQEAPRAQAAAVVQRRAPLQAPRPISYPACVSLCACVVFDVCLCALVCLCCGCVGFVIITHMCYDNKTNAGWAIRGPTVLRSERRWNTVVSQRPQLRGAVLPVCSRSCIKYLLFHKAMPIAGWP